MQALPNTAKDVTDKCGFEPVRAQWCAPYILPTVVYALKFGNTPLPPEDWWDEDIKEMFVLKWKKAGAIPFEY